MDQLYGDAQEMKSRRVSKRKMLEEVRSVVKKARLRAEVECSKRRLGDGEEASTDSEDMCVDKRRIRRRIEEKVSWKVSRMLDDSDGGAQCKAIMDNSVALATLRTAEAIEEAILPELEKIVSDTNEPDAEPFAPSQLQELLCERDKEISRLDRALEEERSTRRKFQARSFEAEQSLIQEKLARDRYVDLWKRSEAEKLSMIPLWQLALLR